MYSLTNHQSTNIYNMSSCFDVKLIYFEKATKSLLILIVNLFLQVCKIEAALVYAIVNLKPPR